MSPVYSGDVSRAIAKIALMHPDDRQELYQFIGPKKYTMEVKRIPDYRRRSYPADNWTLSVLPSSSFLDYPFQVVKSTLVSFVF